MAEEARLKRQQYQLEYKDRKLEGEHDALNNAVQEMLLSSSPSQPTTTEEGNKFEETSLVKFETSADVENKFFEDTE